MDYQLQLMKQEIKEALRNYFAGKADVRWAMAEQCPHDAERNLASAAALEWVADYCLTISDDGPLMSRILELGSCFVAGGIFSEPKKDPVEPAPSARLASQCGFHWSIDPAEFFEEWLTQLETDYPDYAEWMQQSLGVDGE